MRIGGIAMGKLFVSPVGFAMLWQLWAETVAGLSISNINK
ncbi:Uncharacterised protein [Cedecea davisae]|nr:Uncharacterised protein [Cedecea davisae]